MRHGNAKKKEVAPDGEPDHNVFDIEQGTAICLMVKLPKKEFPVSDEPIDEIVFIAQPEPEDGGYSAVCHRYGIFTQGDDLDDLRTMVADAVQGRFADEPAKPQRIRLHFVHDEVLT